MRRLNFLKAIIDFTWIMSMITVPVVIFFIGILIFNREQIDFPFQINGNEITVIALKDKIIAVLLLCSYLFLLMDYSFSKKYYLPFSEERYSMKKTV